MQQILQQSHERMLNIPRVELEHGGQRLQEVPRTPAHVRPPAGSEEASRTLTDRPVQRGLAGLTDSPFRGSGRPLPAKLESAECRGPLGRRDARSRRQE